MRLATFASLLVAGVLWCALGSSPTTTKADHHESSCETCAKKSPGSCPHCAHHGQHGKWGGHQWEYQCVRPAKKPEEVTKQFNALGAQRWRLKEADGGIWCFARVKSPAE